MYFDGQISFDTSQHHYFQYLTSTDPLFNGLWGQFGINSILSFQILLQTSPSSACPGPRPGGSTNTFIATQSMSRTAVRLGCLLLYYFGVLEYRFLLR